MAINSRTPPLMGGPVVPPGNTGCSVLSQLLPFIRFKFDGSSSLEFPRDQYSTSDSVTFIFLPNSPAVPHLLLGAAVRLMMGVCLLFL